MAPRLNQKKEKGIKEGKLLNKKFAELNILYYFNQKFYK